MVGKATSILVLLSHQVGSQHPVRPLRHHEVGSAPLRIHHRRDPHLSLSLRNVHGRRHRVHVSVSATRRVVPPLGGARHEYLLPACSPVSRCSVKLLMSSPDDLVLPCFEKTYTKIDNYKYINNKLGELPIQGNHVCLQN